jgi:hypothetical protein
MALIEPYNTMYQFQGNLKAELLCFQKLRYLQPEIYISLVIATKARYNNSQTSLRQLEMALKALEHKIKFFNVSVVEI